VPVNRIRSELKSPCDRGCCHTPSKGRIDLGALSVGANRASGTPFSHIETCKNPPRSGGLKNICGTFGRMSIKCLPDRLPESHYL